MECTLHARRFTAGVSGLSCCHKTCHVGRMSQFSTPCMKSMLLTNISPHYIPIGKSNSSRSGRYYKLIVDSSLKNICIPLLFFFFFSLLSFSSFYLFIGGGGGGGEVGGRGGQVLTSHTLTFNRGTERQIWLALEI